jgi:hypothetical protein
MNKNRKKSNNRGRKRKKKMKKKREFQSMEEYLRTFFPKTYKPIPDRPNSPRALGIKLVEESLEKIRKKDKTQNRL